jgi:serine protease Do
MVRYGMKLRSCIVLLGLGIFLIPNSIIFGVMPKNESVLRAISDEVASAAEKIRPSVVSVSTISEEQVYAFSRGRILRGHREVPQGMGSGILLDGGFILTNNHVIEGAKKILVKLSDGRKTQASVVGVDPGSDVAVIKISGLDQLVPARLGDSDKMRVGDWVLAMGNPFGLELSVATGIISAKGRADLPITDYADFLQTSAPINPGNSGGPLVDYEGNIIGINTAIIGGAQGLGFAIPINMARNIMQSLIKDGKVTRGYLGVHFMELSPELAEKHGLLLNQGVMVYHLEADSPAARAGLQSQDIILKFAGKDIDSSRKLSMLVKTATVGEEADLVFLRNGKQATVKVRITPVTPQMMTRQTLGIEVVDLTSAVASEFGYARGASGVVISQVDSQSKAAGVLRRGDLIYQINNEPIANLKAYEAMINKLADADQMTLSVARGRRSLEVLVPLK